MSRRKIHSVARTLSKGSVASQEDNKVAETKEDNKLGALAIFLRNLRKCSEVMVEVVVARVVAAKGISQCKDQGEPTSRSISISISWKLSREPRRQSRSIGPMLAPLVKAPNVNQVLHPQLVVAVEVKVSRLFGRVPS